LLRLLFDPEDGGDMLLQNVFIFQKTELFTTIAVRAE
jgi:hypothetical protein